MKRTVVILSGFLLAVSVLSAANIPEQELTGVFRARSGKSDPYLEVHGHGLIKKIAVSGDALKGVPGGAHVWVSGHIVTGLYGSPETESQQAHPTQWMIVFQVTKLKLILKPFKRPQDKGSQNKFVDPISEPAPKRGSRKGSQ